MGAPGTTQVHDYAPPIPPSGLFWIAPLPASAVRADVARGTASMRVRDLAMPDSFDNRGSIVGGPSVPATVSFDVEWDTPIARASIRNEDQQWAGEFVETHSRISWSARQEGFTYQSDPASTSTTVWGMVGRERNGVFFRQLGLPRTGGASDLLGAGRSLGAAAAAGAVLALAGLALRQRRA